MGASQGRGTSAPAVTAEVAEVKDKLKEQFRSWDENKDGLVSSKEFTKVLAHLIPELSASEVESSFRKIDKDFNGFINTNEFVDWLFTAELNKQHLQQLREEAGVSDSVSSGSWYWGHANGPAEPPALPWLTEIATGALPVYYRDLIRMRCCPSYVESLARASPERRCPFAGGTAYTSHADVHRLLATGPSEHLAGRIERGNELGHLKLDDTMFKRYGQIGLGNPLDVHRTQRIWGNVLLEEFPKRVALLQEVHQFLASRDKIEFPKDIDRWWCQVLWRHILHIELSDKEASDFVKFRDDWIAAAVVHVKDVSVAEIMFKDDNINAKQDAYWKRIWTALQDRIPTQDRDCVAQAVLEMFAFAGGLSVPATIQAAVASLHKNYAGERITEDKVVPFVYEVTRLFPAVQSSAFSSGGETHILFLCSALKDPVAWGPDADRFTLKDVSLYKKNHVGFLDPAKADNEGDSRYCPGIQIALDATQAFVLALNSWAFEGDLVHSLWRVTTEIEMATKPVYFKPFTMERVCDKKLGIYSSLLDRAESGEGLLATYTPNEFQRLIETVDRDLDRKPDALRKMDAPTRLFYRASLLTWVDLQHIKNVEPPTWPAIGRFTERNSWHLPFGNIRLPKSDEQWSGMPFMQILAQRSFKAIIRRDTDEVHESLKVRTEKQRGEAIAMGQLAFMMPDGRSYLPATKHTWDTFTTDEAQADLCCYSFAQMLLRRTLDPTRTHYGQFECGASILSELPVRKGFEKMGDTAYFDRQNDGSLKIGAIHWAHADKIIFPSDGWAWEHAKYSWRCSVAVHQTTFAHLVWCHWISANAIATSVREAFNPHHPIRRLLHVNIYNTAMTNYTSFWTLYPENGFLHMMSPFTYEGLRNAFEIAVDMYQFRTWPHVYESTDLPEDLKSKLPVFEDGLPVWHALHEFYAAYVNLYYETEEDLKADGELREYWRFQSVAPYRKGLPPLSKEALIDQLTQAVFDVTAYHELVGNAVEFTTDPSGMSFHVRPGENMADKQHTIQCLSLVASTGSPMPQFLADWSPMLDLGKFVKMNKYKEAKVLHANLMSRLKQVSREIKARNRKRKHPFAIFDPEHFECSVSL